MLIAWIVVMWVLAMAISAWADSELDDWQAEEFGRRSVLVRTNSVDHDDE